MSEFEAFRDSCLSWVARLQIVDWAVLVEEEALPREDEGVSARVFMNWTQRRARVVWNTVYRAPEGSTSKRSPEDDGLHEALHVLLNAVINISAIRGDADSKEVDSEEHSVINRLIRAFKA